jgi:hypothetical protein
MLRLLIGISIVVVSFSLGGMALAESDSPTCRSCHSICRTVWSTAACDALAQPDAEECSARNSQREGDCHADCEFRDVCRPTGANRPGLSRCNPRREQCTEY